MNKAEKLAVPAKILDHVDIFIFDCDGVIWRGDSLIPGIPQVITNLRSEGKKLFFVTNNSTKSRAGYKSKFTSLGLDVQPEEIFSSSFAAAAYLEQTSFKQTGKKVYIIGEKGIGEELDLVGVPWLGAEADKDHQPNMGSGGRDELMDRAPRKKGTEGIQPEFYVETINDFYPGGKFTSLGLDVQPEEIFSSSFAAAAYLEQTSFKQTGKKVYIIGEKGIGEELDLIGIPWLGGEADKEKKADMGPGGRVEIDHDVGAVVVGFDRHINYYKLQYAQLCLNELPGCEFIATNLDRVTHLTDAQEWAGNGTMVGAVSGCTGREPTLVGKPAPLMIDYIAKKYGITDRSRICMVGDRLDTLSGVTSEDELMDRAPRKKGTEGIQPEFYVETINDFMSVSKED
ncbi:PGLP1B [Symbiodinium pilosum]|uniref:PGLP1B protein n=1 Tax=Symbiodinium pilosum TaxID=2952 RepID=A0A812U6M2_SYMPI|nr:PGLP1B [Symbiodinium pilosum]